MLVWQWSVSGEGGLVRARCRGVLAGDRRGAVSALSDVGGAWVESGMINARCADGARVFSGGYVDMCWGEPYQHAAVAGI